MVATAKLTSSVLGSCCSGWQQAQARHSSLDWQFGANGGLERFDYGVCTGQSSDLGRGGLGRHTTNERRNDLWQKMSEQEWKPAAG